MAEVLADKKPAWLYLPDSVTPEQIRGCRGALEAIVDQVIAANPDNVAQFRAGKDKAFNALVGQIMKASKGKANPQQVTDLLRARLAA